MKPHRAFLALALGGALLAAACAPVAETAPQPAAPVVPRETFHRLPPLIPPRASDATTDPHTVVVTPMQAEGALTGTALLSSPGGESVWSTPHAFWDEPLAPRLTRDLVGFLRAVGPFAGVLVGEATRAPADTLVLTPRLLRFQHYVSPSAPGITVSLELTLYEPATDTVRVRATYTETVPLADPGLDAAVEAQGEAVRRIFLRFIRDVGAPAA